MKSIQLAVRTCTTLILFGTFISSCFGAETIKLSGSVPFKEMYFDTHLNEIKTKTNLTIEVIGNGTDRGVADVIEGRSHAAMLAAPIKDIAAKMNEKKPGYVDIASFKEYKIGQCEIVMIGNKANSVKSLTAAQAIGLLSGKIKNWKEVGGSDTPVVVAIAMPGNGIRTTTEKQLLKEATIASDARQVTNPAQVASVVAQLQGGFGPIGKSMLENNVSLIKITDKTIEAPMIIMTKGEASKEVMSIIQALKIINKD